MSSLVADYGSDEDISDDDSVSSNGEINASSSSCLNSNLLISQENDQDGSSSDSEREDNSSTMKSNCTNKIKLPNPLCQEKRSNLGKEMENTSVGMSVFTNRYEQEERAKSSILEKHVQMTEKHPEKGTKKICWKFKKGKCHMGIKCRFFHDQSNITNYALKKDDNEEQFGQHSFNPEHSFGTFTAEPEDDDNYMAGKKRKKKSGVSNSLIPPKLAMFNLDQQRQSERPWTVKK